VSLGGAYACVTVTEFIADDGLKEEYAVDLRRMKPSASDAPSVRHAAESEAQRVERLIMPHLDAAYNLARWLTRRDEDAADIVHEAYLRAMRYADSYAGGSARSWWLAIVRTTYLTWLAKAGAPRSHLALEEVTDNGGAELPVDPAGSPEELAHWSQCAEMLTELIEELPAGFREILVLREMEELSYREIADLLQVPMGTVMSRLARSRELLKRAWAARVAR
jgi:RNA polymerase sigma-70 factor (ECF subfamily)